MICLISWVLSFLKILYCCCFIFCLHSRNSCIIDNWIGCHNLYFWLQNYRNYNLRLKYETTQVTVTKYYIRSTRCFYKKTNFKTTSTTSWIQGQLMMTYSFHLTEALETSCMYEWVRHYVQYDISSLFFLLLLFFTVVFTQSRQNNRHKSTCLLSSPSEFASHHINKWEFRGWLEENGRLGRRNHAHPWGNCRLEERRDYFAPCWLFYPKSLYLKY